MGAVGIWREGMAMANNRNEKKCTFGIVPDVFDKLQFHEKAHLCCWIKWALFVEVQHKYKLLLHKGSHRARKVKFFWTLFKRPLIPPPFIWTFVLFCRGCFLNAFLSIWYNVPILPPNFTINASNVGVREAPCKKSFGILASYWTPPKIK